MSRASFDQEILTGVECEPVQGGLFDVVAVALGHVSPSQCVGCGASGSALAMIGARSFPTPAGLGALCARCEAIGVDAGHTFEFEPVELPRPVAGCPWIDSEDGTCGHPDAYSPECWEVDDGRSDCVMLDGPGPQPR